MSYKFTALNDALYEYLLAQSLREPMLLGRLREDTARLAMAVMQIPPEQGQFLSLLIKLLQVKNVIEVGVFTGYSSLSMAMALPADGRLVCCDNNKEWTDIARAYWRQAGVEDKIEFHLANAKDTLQALIEAGQNSSFDLAFIDADKENYMNYYELCLSLVRPGGLILIDNVLWGGSVIDEQDDTLETRCIRELNRHIHADERVDVSLLPLADGLSMVRRR